MVVDVLAHAPSPPRNKRIPYRITCGDETGKIALVLHAQEDYLMRMLPAGEKRVVSGKIELFDGKRQMTHPDHIAPLHQIEDIKRVEPVYPLTEGLSSKVLDKSIRAAVALVRRSCRNGSIPPISNATAGRRGKPRSRPPMHPRPKRTCP